MAYLVRDLSEQIFPSTAQSYIYIYIAFGNFWTVRTVAVFCIAFIIIPSVVVLTVAFDLTDNTKHSKEVILSRRCQSRHVNAVLPNPDECIPYPDQCRKPHPNMQS